MTPYISLVEILLMKIYEDLFLNKYSISKNGNEVYISKGNIEYIFIKTNEIFIVKTKIKTPDKIIFFSIMYHLEDNTSMLISLNNNKIKLLSKWVNLTLLNFLLAGSNNFFLEK